MRLTEEQTGIIRRTVREVLGDDARVWLFGSRMDDDKRGGDVDLYVESDDVIDMPALVIARLSARIPRGIHGRKVGIVLSAPNLGRFPIHESAKLEGIRL